MGVIGEVLWVLAFAYLAFGVLFMGGEVRREHPLARVRAIKGRKEKAKYIGWFVWDMIVVFTLCWLLIVAVLVGDDDPEDD